MAADGIDAPGPEPTGNRIYAALRRMAVFYEFKPGERINEVELAQRFGTSRTPVREALQRLVTEELITFRPNRGFSCRGFDPGEVVALSDVRAVLEGHAVTLATGRAGAAALDQLTEWWAHVRARADALSAAELTQRDEEFHMRIAVLSGNAQLVKMLAGIDTRIRFVRQIEIEQTRRRSTTYTEHSEICAAMRRGESAEAAQLMHRHIRISADDAIRTVKEGLARIYLPDPVQGA